MPPNRVMNGGREADLEVGLYPRRLRRKRSLTLVQKMSLVSRRYQKLPVPCVVCLSLAVSAILFALVFMYNEAFGTQFANVRTSSRLFSEHNSPYTSLQNLVIVDGHSVYTRSKCDNSEEENSWLLKPCQIHPGQADIFVNHIKAGVETAAGIEDALLLFSGGETTKDAGPRSEAQSYWNLAESKDWFGRRESMRWRALTEEFARDSFENLLFSVCRFRELTGHYPTNITVVSCDLKQRRIMDLHRPALRFPESQFSFVGIQSSPTSKDAAINEESKVLNMFQEDPYGCRGELRKKRIYRDPFLRTPPYPVGCPEMRGLFGYCASEYYIGSLPWTH
uniref:Uncharacterized protein n=1 Tax=Physcomitrium patens TaxID=3218 RepID=A0A2K1KEC2_PHYPA|nr:uncharacterized protein C57A10.07-like isoform X1 [Physcomitrium patens]PNR52128.1 hypothetical protein PHYPA_008502 [Physcomitrium patens]|eukprot:XP_024378659.1 uncharacterized protein C57A10.07-like isoform X1 [Physcomitrella patens]